MQAAMGGKTSHNFDVWSIYGGASVAANPSGHNLGWDASVTENPYKSLPWLGGTLDASGYYNHSSVTSGGTTVNTQSNTYLIMGGPAVIFKIAGLQPFVHVLLGGALASGSQSGFAGPFAKAFTGGSTGTFSLALGAGVDVPVSARLGIRTQWDWLRVGTATTTNLIRGSAGLYYTF